MRMPRRTGKQRNETIIERRPHNQTSVWQYYCQSDDFAKTCCAELLFAEMWPACIVLLSKSSIWLPYFT